MVDLNPILETEYSLYFDDLRKKAMLNSFYKYGSLKLNAKGNLSDTIKNLKVRLALFEETGNTEWLVDVANFAMIEFMYPQHSKAHYKATSSEESPGLVGLSINELKELNNNG